MKENNKILTDKAWEQMESILDVHMPVKKKRFLSMWWSIGVSALLLLSTLVYFSWSSSNTIDPNVKLETQSVYANNEKHIASQEKNKQSVSVDSDIIHAKNNSKTRNESFSANTKQSDNYLKKKNIVTDYNNTGAENYLESKAIEFDYSKVNEEIVKESIIPKEINKKINSSIGRKELKKQLNKLYIADIANLEIEIKEELTAEESYHTQDRSRLESIGYLPFKWSEKLNSVLRDEIVDNRSSLITVNPKPSGNWEFGVFGSYHLVDNDFKGYDIGLTTTFRKGNFGIGLKLGYDHLENTTEQVLQNASLGLSNSSNSNLLQDSRSAGFALSDLILEKNNFMSEANLYYFGPWNMSFSSGIGYKRLLDVSTRAINGFIPDDMAATDFEPEADSNQLLDASLILEDPSVSRNRFYIPFELGYRPLKNVQIGIGTQFFINNVFNDFEEKNRSFFGRISIIF